MYGNKSINISKFIYLNYIIHFFKRYIYIQNGVAFVVFNYKRDAAWCAIA